MGPTLQALPIQFHYCSHPHPSKGDPRLLTALPRLVATNPKSEGLPFWTLGRIVQCGSVSGFFLGCCFQGSVCCGESDLAPFPGWVIVSVSHLVGGGSPLALGNGAMNGDT